MAPPAVGIVSAGEMGAGIGAALVREAGCAVSTVLAGRGPETVARAEEAGMADCPDLAALVAASDLVLSVVPPAIAVRTGTEISQAMRSAGVFPDFVDCNAIAPATLDEVAAAFADTEARFVDGGIVGPPPRDGAKPRLYVSGPESGPLAAIDGIGFDIVRLGPDLGAASALKMTYASITKGTNALLTAALLVAERNGLLEPLLAELEGSQKQMFRRAEANISRLPADSARWAPEMLEIARTFEAAGMPGGFHRGAAEVMELLARSEFGSETRRTLDRSRTMVRTVKVIAGSVGKGGS